MRKSLYNSALVVEALPYGTYTTGANAGSTVDTALYENNFRDVLFVVVAETSGDSGTHTLTVEESANGSDWDDVESWRVQGTVPVINSDNDNALFVFGCSPTQRYVRVLDTADSASTGLDASAVAILSEGSDNPPARA